jgi:hypothetical protein
MMASKKDREKELKALAKEHGAEVESVSGGHVLSLPGERSTLLVTEDTHQHSVERYLRGANA